jgi:two-component system, chemotaxis family, sensor kinase CheA
MAADPYKYFRIEARELLEHLSKGVLELEHAATLECVARLLRHTHTLKGAARVVRQPEIADRAHAIEEVLAPYRDQVDGFGREQATRLLALVDEIARGVAALPAPPAAAAPAGTPVARAAEPAPVAPRNDQGELDAVLDGLIEANASLLALRRESQHLETARRLADVLAGELAPDATRVASVPHDRAAMIEQLRDVLRRHERQLHAGLEQAERELGGVREVAEQLRLVPASSLFTTLERTARDAAHALGKRVLVVARGGDVRLDGHVLSVLQPMLIQLVRNAVAHGIESEAERARAGKPAAGTVTIDVARRGRNAVFSCRDDGRGLDVAAIRRRARERGIAMSDRDDAVDLVGVLLHQRISTSSNVTEVSGRAIGLDVVRSGVEQLGGEVRIETTSGSGTRFDMIVPVTLAAIEALVCESAGVDVVLPLDSVRGVRRVTAADISHGARGEMLQVDGVTIPFLELARVMPDGGTTHVSVDGRRTAIVVAAADRVVAIGVDRLEGVAQVVVRPIPDVVQAEAIVAGAALDAHGAPRLVLDADALVAAAQGQAASIRPAARRRTPVLVIDDSMTTRLLEKSILEAAGYDVDTAMSAEEALDVVQRKRYSLFLVDVEMPGIDGFTFIERIRADQALASTPAILVTSRNSAEDRARGRQVGAQGYVVKSEFDQVDLLAQIQRLVADHA